MMASCLEIVNESTNDKSNELPPELLLQLQNVKLGENNIDDRDKIFVPDWLKHCESPFLWHSQSKRGEGSKIVIQKSLEKIEELQLEETELTLQHFILLLKLVLEYYVLNDMEKSWSTMKTVEDDFENMVTSGSPECECLGFKMPLGHLLFTTKSHLLMLVGDEEKSKKIARIIIPTKVMPVEVQAAMWALKARFFLYSGYENGESIGVESARKALELDPENAEWNYLLAKLLRQERKEKPFSVEVPKEELILLEKAVEKNKNAKYLVYLAQVYMECGTKAFKQHRLKPDFFKSPLCQTIENMHIQALKLYKEALDLKPKSPSTLRRIGYGIMNLPKKIADYKLALQCLEKSMEICHSQITMHMLGTYYHRYALNNEKALEYFEKLTKEECHAGLCDMVRIKYILDPTGYNPCNDLESALAWKQKQKCRSLLLVQLGTYYLFIKRDLFKSIPYFNQVIEEDSDSPHMKICKSFFLRMYEPINLYEYIINEAMLLLRKFKASKPREHSISDEEECYTVDQLGCVEDLICKISDILPELMEITPDPTLVDKLIQTSNENAQNENKRNRNNNENRDRQAFRGGIRENPRGRGGSYPNQRGRGDRGGCENYQQRMPSGESLERRGRFSYANQRDQESNPDFRGKSYSTNQSDRLNWRQGQDSSRNENYTKKAYKPNDSQENWRKK